LPTYEYHCDSCDRNFDIAQSFHDEPLTACPTCGSPVRKVFGNVGIVFKGSGFYKTDSRSGAGTKAAADGSAASAESSGSGTDSGSGSGSGSGEKASGGDGSSKSTPSPSTTPAKPATTPSNGKDGRGSSKPKTAPA